MSGDTVLVAMSGGVDSSVAAAMLVRTGCRVVGATMKTFCYSDTNGPAQKCCGLEGISDARAVAAALGFPHQVFDLEKEFADDVVRDFVQEYAAGRTPIPCVRCNSFTKFRDLVRRADALDCRYMATGHYARVTRGPEGSCLRRAEDDRKDQTYFLWGIPRTVLDRLLLPVGDLTKDEVRETARSLGLITADKPESFEICFVPDDDYSGVLRDHLGEFHPALTPGPLVLEDGTEIRPESRTVVVGPRESLASTGLVAGGANWLADRPRAGDTIGVRIRHGAPIVEARVRSASAKGFALDLKASQAAVTPGQSAVLYSGDVVVGGGIIL